MSITKRGQYLCGLSGTHIILIFYQKLHKEIHLTDVKDVKAHRSNNQMFTFYVHFDGKDSPWILSANSQVRGIVTSN